MSWACAAQICFCLSINPLSLTDPLYHNTTGTGGEGGGGWHSPPHTCTPLSITLHPSLPRTRHLCCQDWRAASAPIDSGPLLKFLTWSELRKQFTAIITTAEPRPSGPVIKPLGFAIHLKSTGSGKAWGSMLAKVTGATYIFVYICMHTFVCVQTGSQQHYRPWLNSKIWGEMLSGTDWL